MKDMISVVVICYNHATYIEQCLQSIFKQTYQNLELIVINDGSTDASKTIIETQVEDSPFPQTTFVTRENRGVVFSRNQGLELCHGKYLLFVDSDNFLNADYIEKLYYLAEEKGTDIVYTKLINPENKEIVIDGGRFEIERFIQGNFIDMCSLIRIEKIGPLRFDDYFNRKGLEDYDFFMSLILEQDAKASYCETTFLNYRVLRDSRSNRGNLKSYYPLYFYIIKKHLSKQPERFAQAISYHLDQLTRLDIEHSIREEKISVYISENEEFTEAPVYEALIQPEDNFIFPVKKGRNYIRITPSNIPSFYESFTLREESHSNTLQPTLSNGIIEKESLVFENFYPFVEFYYEASKETCLELAYKRYNISDIVAENYIGKKLARSSFNHEKQIESYNQQKEELQKENEKLVEKYEELLVNYQAVVDSKRWQFINRLLNLFRRKK